MQTLQNREKKKTTDSLVRLYSTRTHTHTGDLPNSLCPGNWAELVTEDRAAHTI